MPTELKHIPLAKVRQNSVALREVDKKSEAYIGLLDSVRTSGILNPINVREFVDPETKETFYSVIDGLHRFTASLDAGLTEIPAQVLSMADADVLKAQLIANVHKVETKPVEYSKQLQRILSGDPFMTISKLASILSKTPTWLSERLGLTKLIDDIAKLVDGGKINLSNAYALAKLPPEHQANYVDQAMTMTPQEFTPKVLQAKKELDKARREGRDSDSVDFQPAPHLQKIAAIKGEMEKPKIGPELVKLLKLDKVDSKTEAAEKGFNAAIQWVLHMDPVSVEQQRKDHEARKEAIKAKKDAAAAERTKKKAEEATTKAARLQLEADTRLAGGNVDEALKAFDAKHGLVDGKKPEAPKAQ